MYPRTFRFLSLLPAALVLAACVAEEPSVSQSVTGPSGGASGDILAIGDSILAWNRETGQSIPDVVAAATGRSVVNRAVVGERISAPPGYSNIPIQFDGGQWDTVIMDGGANDLLQECYCNACEGTLNELLSPDGLSGEIPNLVRRIRSTGANVVMVGYYGPMNGGSGDFDRCNDELLTLGERMGRLAASDPGIKVVRTRPVIDGSPQYYSADRVHPSPAGSAAIGQRVAAALP